MRMLRSIGFVLLSLSLSGCNTIEHRSDEVVKEPLPKLSHPLLKANSIWTNSNSSGVGKKAINLRLAVADGEVFVADYKGNILALDRANGKSKWSLATKTNISSGPVVLANKIVVGTDDGFVYTYSAKEGELLWKSSVSGPVVAAPAGDSNTVFVHILNGSVLALNASNGKELWRYQVVNTPSIMLRQSSSPVLSQRDVLVGFSNGKLIAFDKRDGGIDWEREIAVAKGRSDLQRMVDVCTDPIIKDNTVYAVSYQGQLAALELETGNPIWEKELSSFSGIAVTAQAVLVSDPKGVVWSLNRKSGEVLWKQSGLSGRILSQPVVMDNYVIVGDDDGYLHWISLKDGSFAAQHSFDGKGIEATPIVKDNILYVLGRSGKVGAFQSLAIQQGL